MIDRLSEVPNEDAREEHACRAKADPFDFHTPKRHPDHTYESEHAYGVRYGLSLVEFEEPVHPSSRRRCGLALWARAGSIALEIFVEEPGEFLSGGIEGRFVCPAFARAQHFGWDFWDFGDDVEAKDRVAFGRRLGESATMDRVDDGACVFQADAFSGAVSATGPTRVHQPHTRVVFGHLLREKLGILVGLQHEE